MSRCAQAALLINTETKVQLKRLSGFTLVEVLAVLIIVAILAGIGTPIYLSYVKGARSADAQTTISAIVTANKVYYQKYGNYSNDMVKLETSHLVQIDEATKTKWDFTLVASGDQFSEVRAISKEDMPGGGGKTVNYLVKTGKFHGYGTDDDNQ
jgi:prepilin-type N-terminal cleavage/methylation domain-containing protein